MKKQVFMLLTALTLFCGGQAHAQWVVTDPGNFAGNIANSVKEIATASKTERPPFVATSMVVWRPSWLLCPF